MIEAKDLPARATGTGESIGTYVVADDQMAAGSTLGGSRLCMTIKASGAVEKIFSIDAGRVLLGTTVLHFWDSVSGAKLSPLRGHFVIHPEHQEHLYDLPNHVSVKETLFALRARPGDERDPPLAYYHVRLHNDGPNRATMRTYAFCQLRGETDHDVVAVYDAARSAFVAWNQAEPKNVRLFGVTPAPTGFETTHDHDKPVSFRQPHPLAGRADVPPGQDTLGVFESSHELAPGESAEFSYVFAVTGAGRAEAERTYDSAAAAADALAATKEYFAEVLSRAMVITPDDEINRGVLWAKANMLRTVLKPTTGWSFVNDPTRSNNSVGRDTAWFGYGADYVFPDIAREALSAYVDLQEPSGMIVEYYDIRDNKTADYGLNVNDNTPLIVLALLHHYHVTGDRAFLERIYPAAVRAGNYLLSQRDARGLIWCSSTKTSDWGIVGWRNVIQGYRLSGATTELNSECYAALRALATMARELGQAETAGEFSQEADALHAAIHAHLYNPDNDLYYLNIDVDGVPRSDVTVDLVFPAMFGVADEAMTARIVNRLSADEFWTDAGIRTVPRGAPNYGATHGYGLLGGVWVGATFWFAFAAARVNADLMARSLSRSFAHYAHDPRKNNTVPGQFSEWLHGETLTNEGMMLSPWFPPRFVWAALEGVTGIDASSDPPGLSPRPAPSWTWHGVRNLPFRNRTIAWFVACLPEPTIYATTDFAGRVVERYEEDITGRLRISGAAVTAIGFRRADRVAVLVGSSSEHSAVAALAFDDLPPHAAFAAREYSSLRNAWLERGVVAREVLASGLPLELGRKGFCLIELEAIDR